MKIPWIKVRHQSISWEAGGTAIVYRSSSSDPAWWADAGDLTPDEAALAAYLEQLLNEGMASQSGGGVTIGWGQLYQLLASEEHASSIPLLGLPPFEAWAPHLDSWGTPSESEFGIEITGWSSPRHGFQRLVRTGAVLQHGGSQFLLSEDVWRLSQAVDRLPADLEGHGHARRLAAVGRIQSLARAAGAHLDDYLEHTPVVLAEKLDIGLKRTDVAGTLVVEVVPSPRGVPDGFVSAFDAYDSVRDRYDLPQGDGSLVHVVPNPTVASALTTIKRWPGRRLASDDARLFAHNPYAALGDEAHEVLDEEALLEARRAAGLLPYRLRFLPSGHAGPEIEVFSIAEFADPERHGLTPEIGRTLLGAAGKSRAKRLPLFHWNGNEIELSPETEAALSGIGRWLVKEALPCDVVTLSQIFDLAAYSDRVVGFQEAMVQRIPYVKRKDSGVGWIPDNVGYGVAVVDPESGAVSFRELTSEQKEQFAKEVQRADDEGRSEIAIPGSDLSVPISEAKKIFGAYEQADISIAERKSPVAVKAPHEHSAHATLVIHHNIEQLDYANDDVAWSPEGKTSAEIPKALRPVVQLLPHQVDGLAWLQQRYRARDAGVTGCLLADDMGLGKTLQSLCLIAWHDEQSNESRPCLVVAPVSLLDNWRQEIRRFLNWDEKDVLSLYGADLAAFRMDKAAIDKDLQAAGVRKLLETGFEFGRKVVLTTYETLRDYEFSLARVHWGIVVCDEAQKIKNPAAFVTQAAKALRADFRIACTGTPVENSLADLWCLFDFVQPGFLRSLNEFTREFRASIEGGDERRGELVGELRNAIDPWVLRRMKTDVHKGLPKKIDGGAVPSGSGLQMSTLQSGLYAKAISDYQEARDSGGAGGSQILQVLHRLRLICANPLAVAVPDHENRPISEHLAASPKLAWVLERLGKVKQLGEKAIVFTEFREMQRLLQRAISSSFGYHAQVINGSTEVSATSETSRQRLIDRFQVQPGFGVIILSTTAVGFGVNIQAANHVIHFTRPWNPAKEDQATDRAYRIGQTRDVYVDCPTVVGGNFESFEQRLHSLLARKRELSFDLLSGSQEVTAADFAGII